MEEIGRFEESRSLFAEKAKKAQDLIDYWASKGTSFFEKRSTDSGSGSFLTDEISLRLTEDKMQAAIQEVILYSLANRYFLVNDELKERNQKQIKGSNNIPRFVSVRSLRTLFSKGRFKSDIVISYTNHTDMSISCSDHSENSKTDEPYYSTVHSHAEFINGIAEAIEQIRVREQKVREINEINRERIVTKQNIIDLKHLALDQLAKNKIPLQKIKTVHTNREKSGVDKVCVNIIYTIGTTKSILRIIGNLKTGEIELIGLGKKLSFDSLQEARARLVDVIPATYPENQETGQQGKNALFIAIIAILKQFLRRVLNQGKSR